MASLLAWLPWLLVSILSIYLLDLLAHARRRLPPGPRPFPLIGSLHLLGDQPHRSLADLAKTHGPLMPLRLGSVTTVVVSSPDIAREVLQKHDAVFATRYVNDAAGRHARNSVPWLPNAPRGGGRRPRGVHDEPEPPLGHHLLHGADEPRRPRRVQGLPGAGGRDHGARRVAERVGLLAGARVGGPAGPAPAAGALVRAAARRVRRGGGREAAGARRRRAEEGEQRRLPRRAARRRWARRRQSGARPRHAQLPVHGFFVAGSDTSSSTVEWAMAELLRDPSSMAKAHEELARVVGSTRSIEESDIEELPYLQAVVKETFRLHPSAPLLLPRQAQETIRIKGYTVPQGSRVLVNMWAMGRDEAIWPEPDKFMPERFLGRAVDYKGGDFELIPFGAGRRVCPGLPLATRMVHLVLATLLNQFKWRLPVEVERTGIEMGEKFGLTLTKAVSLCAIATPI